MDNTYIDLLVALVNAVAAAIVAWLSAKREKEGTYGIEERGRCDNKH